MKTFSLKFEYLSLSRILLIFSFFLFRLTLVSQNYFEETVSLTSGGGAVPKLTNGLLAKNVNITEPYYFTGIDQSNSQIFYLNNTDINGAFSGAAFASYYDCYSSCTALPSGPQQNFVEGVSMVEIINTSIVNGTFAIVGSTTDGFFFAVLDDLGAVTSSAFYSYPSGAYSPSKPVIAVSPVVTNPTFYVAGSYVGTTGERTMFVMELTSAGTVVNSQAYNFLSPPSQYYANVHGYVMLPKDIIYSSSTNPITSLNELVIVGDLNEYNLVGGPAPTNNPHQNAFLLRLNPSNLNPVKGYGYLSNWSYTNFNGLNSIDQDANGDFIIAGYTDEYLTPYYLPWVAKVDIHGNIIWSYCYVSTYNSSIPNGSDCKAVSVKSRTSSQYSQETYFILEEASQQNTSYHGVSVFKLNQIGDPFRCGGCGGCPSCVSVNDDNNEFLFPFDNFSAEYPVEIDIDKSGTINGLHVFGGELTNNEYFLAHTHFNGVTDAGTCPSFVNNSLANNSYAPTDSLPFVPNVNTGLTLNCTNVITNLGALSVNRNLICSTNTPLNGSNNKIIQSQMLKDPSLILVISENPNSGNFKIICNRNLTLKMFNNLGQEIRTINLNAVDETFQTEIEGLPSGVYLINCMSNSEIISKKIIVTN